MGVTVGDKNYNPLDDLWYDKLENILESDDLERFLPLLSAYGNTVTSMKSVSDCASFRAKKCLLATIQGEVCAPANQIYARLAPDHDPEIPTPLACVACDFPEADDIIDLLLKQGGVDHANIKCRVDSITFDNLTTCPLDYVFLWLSELSHLLPWASGDSLIKLIILLCQWETKPTLNSARLLAPHTDGINDIAWSYVKQGKLAYLAGLLLVAQEKVLVPFDSGLTIRQRIMDMVQKFSSEGDLDYERAMYQSMLIEAYKLFDIFERAGDALSLYCSSMHEYVSPDKVLNDVASLLKKAGYALEPIDVDLRDCYRDCPELLNATVFKLSDPGIPNNKYRLPSSLTRAQASGATLYSYPYPGNCQLFRKVNSGPLLNLKHASEPRLLRTAAAQIENCGTSIIPKHLAYIAFRLKRGIKF